MSKLKFITVLFCLSFWPLNLFLANIFSDFLRYLIPALLVGLSIILFTKGAKVYFIPLLFIPFVEPKLASFPLLTLLGLFFIYKKKSSLIYITISLLIIAFMWKNFWGQTIFQYDYEAQQEVIGKSYLYPSVFMARLFQNKPRIYINKFTSNFLALTDPNNYFFKFHPREIIIDNQNLSKYPFMSIIFALFGLFYLGKNTHWKFISTVLVAGVLSLSILKIFDRNDFLLWIPILLVIIHGIRNFKFKRKLLENIFYLIFAVFTMTELLRIIITTRQ